MDLSDYLKHKKHLYQSFVLLVIWITASVLAESKTVSQCHGGQAFSFVSLYCGFRKVIQIQRAFHGSHRNPEIDHCGYLEEDCTMDTTHLYDWTKCEGRHSCVQMIRPREMDTCSDKTMLYLQVHYACVPGTAYMVPKPQTPPTSSIMVEPRPSVNQPMPGEDRPPAGGGLGGIQGGPLGGPLGTVPGDPIGGGQHLLPRPKLPPTKPAIQPTSTSSQGSAHNICSNRTWVTETATIASPGYPNFYPVDTECRCMIKGQEDTKVAVTYQALSLIMRADQCVDWLLLQSLGYKNSAAVTCGQMQGKEKTLMAKGNWLLMHFHTAKGGKLADIRTLAGFKVLVKTQPEGPFEVQCHPTPPEVLQSLKYKDSQLDMSNNTLLPQFDINTLPSGSSSVTIYGSSFVTAFALAGMILSHVSLH